MFRKSVRLFLVIVCLLGSRLASSAPESTHNQLGWTLFSDQAPTENVFLSPTSVYTALGLLLDGSQEGPTRDAANAFMGFEKSSGNTPLRLQLDAFKALKTGKGVEINLANSIWLDSKSKDLKEPSPAFMQTAKETFDADIRRLSFNPLSTLAKLINEWVGQKTKGMIRRLVSEQDLVGANVVVTNAIHFKGVWKNQFKKENTRKATFNTPKNPVEKLFMEQTSRFRYFANDDVQVLELPYQGDEVSMTIILPRKADDLGKLEKTWNADALRKLETGATMELVHAEIPKFEIEWGVKNIKETLVKAGMPISGDFTPLGATALEIKKVLHKAVIKVDEEGTVAAAATAITSRGSGGPGPEPKLFIANRPFLFSIQHRLTTKDPQMLFIGRVVNP